MRSSIFIRPILLIQIVLMVISISFAYESLAAVVVILINLTIELITGGGTNLGRLVSSALQVYFAKNFLAVLLIESIFWVVKYQIYKHLRFIIITSFWISITPFMLYPLLADNTLPSIIESLSILALSIRVSKYIDERFTINQNGSTFNANYEKTHDFRLIFKGVKNFFNLKSWLIGYKNDVHDRSYGEMIIEPLKPEFEYRYKKPFIFISILIVMTVSILLTFLTGDFNTSSLLMSVFGGFAFFLPLSMSNSPWVSIFGVPIPILINLLLFRTGQSYFTYDNSNSYNIIHLAGPVTISFLFGLFSSFCNYSFKENEQEKIKIGYKNRIIKLFLAFGIGLGFTLIASLASIFSYALIGNVFFEVINYYLTNYLGVAIPSGAFDMRYFAEYSITILVGLTIIIGVPVHLRLSKKLTSSHEKTMGISAAIATKIAIILTAMFIITGSIVGIQLDSQYFIPIINGSFIGLLIATYFATIYNYLNDEKLISRAFAAGLFTCLIAIPLLSLFLTILDAVLIVANPAVNIISVIRFFQIKNWILTLPVSFTSFIVAWNSPKLVRFFQKIICRLHGYIIKKISAIKS